MNRAGLLLVAGAVITLGGAAAVRLRQLHEEGQRTACQNNLKQIALAVHGYLDNFKRFPQSFAHDPWEKHDARLLPLEQRPSWLYGISPFVEARMDPKFKLDFLQPINAEANRYVTEAWMPYYLCPVNDDKGTTKNFSHYVGITGLGIDASQIPLTDRRCGIFGNSRIVKMADIKDGSAQTLAIIETNVDNRPWAVAGYGTARGLDTDRQAYLGEAGQFHSFHTWRFPMSSRSFSNAAFADASVRALSEELSPTVFEAMATIAAGDNVPDWD